MKKPLAPRRLCRQRTTNLRDDWPLAGPDRTGISKETGLLKQRLRGRQSCGRGEASATATDRWPWWAIASTWGGARGSAVIALNRADGKEVWSKALGRTELNDQGPGPRGTPTVDGDRIYVLSEAGDLHCLKIDGTEVWHRNILSDFGGRQLRWLISESPLVDGDAVIVAPGGSGTGMVKLDKATGKTIWTSKGLSDEAGYSSNIVADIGGVRTYMRLTSEAGVGVRASDGKLMWHYERAANRTANITTPIFFDNKCSTHPRDTGAGLLALRPQNGEVKGRRRSTSRANETTMAASSHRRLSVWLQRFDLTCLEFATGKLMWRDRQRRQGIGHVRRRQPLCAGREQHVRPGRGVAVRVPREGALSDRRKGAPELGPSGHQRRPAVRAKSGHADGLRHQSQIIGYLR
jgi:outer membrane protein assembly factor BamB